MEIKMDNGMNGSIASFRSAAIEIPASTEKTLDAARLSHPKYRGDIDGMRAIAVLCVVIFHAFPAALPGGFVGVDVFFVISGFLISTILFENLERGTFSFVEFYSRRIRRIFPALMTILIATYLAGWALLFAPEFKQLSKNAAGGVGFLSNLLLWRENGYFASDSATNPLLHLWSLGIEEQFYFIWPVSLWVASRLRINLLAMTLLAFVVSMYCDIHASHIDAVGMFYLPQSRFWELLVGAALAYVALHRIRPVFSPFGRDVLSVSGLTMLVASASLLSSASLFPGWWALVPTIGTMLIIGAGPNAFLNRTILAHPVLKWFGVISFPLYLSHWPLLSFARIVSGDAPSSLVASVAIVVAIASSWLIYRYMEKPIRAGKELRYVPALTAAAACVLLIASAGFLRDGTWSRLATSGGFGTPSDDRYYFLTRTSDQSCPGYLGVRPLPEEVCLVNSKTPEVLFVGDSHAISLYLAIFAGRFSIPAVLVAAHGCPPYANLKYQLLHQQSWQNNCTEIAREALRVAAMSSIKTVFVTQRIAGTFSTGESIYWRDSRHLSEKEAFVSGNEFLIEALLRMGKRVVYVMDVPHLKYQPMECEPRVDFVAAKDCAVPRETQNLAVYRETVGEIKELYPQMSVVDPNSTLCDPSRCYARDHGGYFYADYDHLNVHGSDVMLRSLLSDLH